AIRGEAAYAHKRWSPAEEAFRFLVGQVEHPLYAYGLYRTAAVHNAHGEPKEAKAAYTEASEMGCRRGVSAATQEAALFAAQALDIAGRQDPDGVVRPASCPVGGREPPKSLDDI
ncbi:MAG: hypothetical protein KC417_17855, partial [Myxococcales bacterium]|nr:hypothetical protein [Myxococcales bacterium]